MKQKIKKYIYNLPGWRTRQKIVIIESDDWGSIRMPSKTVVDHYVNTNSLFETCEYSMNDALESEADLSSLYSVLNTHKDSQGNQPVITANFIMTNPDFKRIEASGFKTYYFEPFFETLKKYPLHENVTALYKEGIAQDIFYPQFHGREHLHILRWMHALQQGLSETTEAFKYNIAGLSKKVSSETRKSYMPAFDFDSEEELLNQKRNLKEGLELFSAFFSYPSRSFIAPNYTWHPELEAVLNSMGVQYIQGAHTQRIPGNNGITIKRHYLGQKNPYGQTFLTRNCRFEPSSDQHKDWISSCLEDIVLCFRMKKPAIIESHRVNFMGFINPDNRDKNLELLDQLLSEIERRWPDVIYMNTVQLGDLITRKTY